MNRSVPGSQPEDPETEKLYTPSTVMGFAKLSRMTLSGPVFIPWRRLKNNPNPNISSSFLSLSRPSLNPESERHVPFPVPFPIPFPRAFIQLTNGTGEAASLQSLWYSKTTPRLASSHEKLGETREEPALGPSERALEAEHWTLTGAWPWSCEKMPPAAGALWHVTPGDKQGFRRQTRKGAGKKLRGRPSARGGRGAG